MPERDAKRFDPVTVVEVKAMISFVRQKIPYEARVGRIVRTISEAVHFDGQYRNSTEAKSHNLIMSRSAAELIPQCTGKREFEKQTVLEHPLPIKWMYIDFLLPLGANAAFGSVVEAIGSFPLITVTQKENLRLTNRVRLTPRQRYGNAGIEVGCVDRIAWGEICSFVPEILPEI
jgi:hypothetical protein